MQVMDTWTFLQLGWAFQLVSTTLKAAEYWVFEDAIIDCPYLLYDLDRVSTVGGRHHPGLSGT